MTKAKVTLSISEDAIQRIKTQSARLGVSMSAFMTMCTLQQCEVLESAAKQLLSMKPEELLFIKNTFERMASKTDEWKED